MSDSGVHLAHGGYIGGPDLPGVLEGMRLIWANECPTPRIAQQRSIRVAKSMPAQSREPDPLAFRPENLALDDACVVATTGDMRGKNKPRASITFASFQNSGEGRIEREVVIRSLGFDPSDAPVDDSLLNTHHSGLEIDMFPAEGQNFRNP